MSTRLKRTTLAVGVMILATLVYISTGATWESSNFSLAEGDFYTHSDLSNNPFGDPFLHGGTKLNIPLTGPLSLDLDLSSVDTGQAITGVKSPGAPPIPLMKSTPYRLGAGFSFRF